MHTSEQKRLLDLLKALSDDSRLNMVRLLHADEYAVGDLAAKVNLTEPTVSHHLARLREVGLVILRMDGNRRLYKVNATGLAKFKALVDKIEVMPLPLDNTPSDDQWIEALAWDDEDRQVLRDYTKHGKLTHLPRKQKKLLIILRWLATLFQEDVLYTEPQVNAILKAVYERDYVSLRRDLVDVGYLRRERGGGKYWLAPADEHMQAVSEQ